jgi:hypothetical protein
MDWKTYHNVCKTPDDNSLVKAIGNAETLGNVRLSGPFLMRDDDWLFPVPLDLFHAKQGYGLLAPSATLVECDLGKIHLPAGKGEGLKIQEGKYVTSQAMVDLLAGRTTALPSIWKLFADDPKEGDALADLEPKVGLERDNALRKHKEGRLYSIALVRLREHVQLAVAVSGLPAIFNLLAPSSNAWVEKANWLRSLSANCRPGQLCPDLRQKMVSFASSWC